MSAATVSMDEVISEVYTASYDVKRNEMTEEQRINKFLDKINSTKKILLRQTETLGRIVLLMEKVTHLNNVNDDGFAKLNAILSLSKDYQHNLKRFYVDLGGYRQKGILKDEIKAFKGAVDDFVEVTHDLKLVFFVLPADKGFQSVAKALRS